MTQYVGDRLTSTKNKTPHSFSRASVKGKQKKKQENADETTFSKLLKDS